MELIDFLEQMAASAHYDEKITNMIKSQSAEVIAAYRGQKGSLLKGIIGESGYIANPSDVAQV